MSHNGDYTTVPVVDVAAVYSATACKSDALSLLSLVSQTCVRPGTVARNDDYVGHEEVLSNTSALTLIMSPTVYSATKSDADSLSPLSPMSQTSDAISEMMAVNDDYVDPEVLSNRSALTPVMSPTGYVVAFIGEDKSALPLRSVDTLRPLHIDVQAQSASQQDVEHHDILDAHVDRSSRDDAVSAPTTDGIV